ncbi:hypothetical protein BE17_36740 [Sorangium cellulosum]|uniref:Secreted protein n=1 Tax=Sorangium cellulosum TaxID=56 RepID=A0A150RAF7_SORCE|nr:hypothetical protein BE17_36740 [Sorangium cellulosum]
MSTHPSTRTPKPLSAAMCLIALSGIAALGSGCNQSEAATSRAAEAPAAAPQGGKSKVEDAVYTLEMKPTGTYKAGQEGLVEVSLLSKGDYHINDKYPIKFKVAEAAAEGVSYPKPLLKREDGSFEENKGLLKVPFVAAKKGKTKVAGVLSFSICSAANCLMQKQELEAVIDVQ